MFFFEILVMYIFISLKPASALKVLFTQLLHLASMSAIPSSLAFHPLFSAFLGWDAADHFLYRCGKFAHIFLILRNFYWLPIKLYPPLLAFSFLLVILYYHDATTTLRWLIFFLLSFYFLLNPFQSTFLNFEINYLQTSPCLIVSFLLKSPRNLFSILWPFFLHKQKIVLTII